MAAAPPTRKLALKMSMTVDGFIAGPNGEIDWMMKSRDEAGVAWTVAQISKAGAHLVGRKSFEQWATYWPEANSPFAAPMNEIPKIVFSRSGFDVSGAFAGNWREALVLTGDLAQELTKLKQQTGEILVAHGGVEFAQSLVRTGLVDEFWFSIHPVTLGQGLALFSELKETLHLELVSSRSFTSGTLANIYRPKL